MKPLVKVPAEPATDSSITCGDFSERYANDLYSVSVVRGHPFIRLSILRLDGQPFKTWKDLQEIKNQLVGLDHEAAELFPAQSRQVCGTNEYHLWVHADPEYRFPFGFRTERVVIRETVMPLEGPTALASGHALSPIVQEVHGQLN